jgi:hypothetical protein
VKRALIAACVLAAGCSRAAPREAPATVTLEETIRSLKTTPPCRSAVPDEWVAGWPVPASPKDGRRFKLFFYPLTVAPGSAPAVWTPGAEASFEVGRSSSLVCNVSPGASRRLSDRRWPAEAEGWSYPEFDRQKALLYRRTEEVAALYAAGKSDPAATREYAKLFKSLAEPDLLPYYQRLDPAFWAWLEKSGG